MMGYQREFAKKINVGIIGIGSHSYRNILPAMNYLPVQVKAVCNRSVDIGKATAAQYGCEHYQSTEEMYAHENIDAVFISVSPQMHPKLTVEALDQGKHGPIVGAASAAIASPGNPSRLKPLLQ